VNQTVTCVGSVASQIAVSRRTTHPRPRIAQRARRLPSLVLILAKKREVADVVPLTHRAKYTMMVQSTVALALFGLIVARAVNAFA
jgi:hypothetical protein